MPQPVSFCTACPFAPTRFANPPVLSSTENPCAVSLCAVTRTDMTYKTDYEQRHVDAIQETQILFTLDLAGNFKYVNSAAEHLFGYSAAEMCRMNFVELVPPGFAHYLQGQITQTVAGELGAVYEIEIYTKPGHCLALEISTRLVMRNGCPFELEGIAFPKINIFGGRPRCLDEEFWIGPGLNGPSTLTFLPTR